MRLVLAALAMGLLALLPAVAQSQATTGIIEGTVVDETGSPIPAVQIEMINKATNYTKNVNSDARGRFRGLLLPLGPYRVRGNKEGFYISQQDGLNVSVGKTVVVKIEMKPIENQEIADLFSQLDELSAEAAEERAEIIESITVAAGDFQQVVETARVESSVSLSEEEVQGLPNNGRNFLDFSLLTPGVTIAQGPDGAVISVNGQKGINNNVSVDGADFNNPFFGEQRGGQRAPFTFNLDAVQEVVVVGDGAPAEFGRSSSGFINVITKSGTNQLKGSGHFFLRDDELNAKAENPDGSLAEKFPFSQNQVGFTLGGPIVKDKAFFFVSFDLQEADSTKQLDSARIEDRVVSFFRDLGYPDENAPITRTNNAHAFLAKFDWNVNQSNLLTFRFTDSGSEQENGTFDVDSWGRSANAVEVADTWSFSGQLNSVLTGSLINELRFQYSREDRPRSYNGPNLAGQNRPLPDTAFDFGRGYRFGMPFFIPVEYHDTRLQINNNLSIIAGNHLIKIGVEANITEATQTFVGFANGRWIFSSTDGFFNYAANPSYVECSDGSASFDGVCPEGTDITGPVLLYLQQAGLGGRTVEEAGTQTIDVVEPAFFIQDKWDLAPNMSLNVGLRWEMQEQPDPITPPNEVFFADFIGTTRNGMAFPSDGTIPSDDQMWQPRIGFTWDPGGKGKEVLRMSAGIYYARIPGLAVAGTRNTNGSVGQSIFRNSELTPVLGPPPAYPDILAVDSNATPFRPDVTVYDKNFRNPRSDQFSITYEREIFPQTSAYVKVTHIKGRNQTRFLNLNDPLLGSPWSTGLGEDGQNGIGNLTVVESGGESVYTGFTLGFNKLFSDRLLVQGHYTYAKDKSHDDNERDPFSFRYARITDLEAEWGYSDRDQRHRFSTWILWQAPYAFNVNMRFNYRSAQPLSLTEDGTPANTPQDRINADGSIFPRNTGRKDNQFSTIDLRISRNFQLNDRVTLEAVFEVFNAANSKNLLAPSVTNLIFNFDGTVQAGTGTPRQMQLGLKTRF
ncbi:TonB-dependent receptor [Acanthopleuribacter pedis]|uniref:TonB-dependent receptor n=1 Tax=Acanthopleuribacter pedis TaxID=442870 RepID=A0A8J7U744_9BACT|nr:TonB-dependent receptor [Acanthopleuribacter pedis]MBO1323432.1 TonB-dependent receptor [Acanthopleuribacter pedis]